MTHIHKINNLKSPFENGNSFNSLENWNVYVLYIPLASKKFKETIKWNELAEKFSFKIIRERRNQVTVKATPNQVERFQELYPDIEVTLRRQYKASFTQVFSIISSLVIPTLVISITVPSYSILVTSTIRNFRQLRRSGEIRISYKSSSNQATNPIMTGL